MSANLLQKPSAEYLEQLLHKAAIDADFREELLASPEAFGIPADTELVLPTSVEKQDRSFVNLFNDALGELNIVAQCASTCSFGPYTVICDGTTK
ncbi:cinnamycin family lantibiotic [Scytonema sp. PCC 10023]|uniref:cinnamycin family lantibiotic n=1 Tax=Scytonema sp. PCC 10023 TaxID=1680591 RepID=UPI0039C5EE76